MKELKKKTDLKEKLVSIPTENNDIYQKSTLKLKKIITQAKNTGKAAWTAGKILAEIKNNNFYKLKYSNFSEYTFSEFRVKELTANTYISIFESFLENEIGELIVSNLKVISEIKNRNLRKDVINAFLNHKSSEYTVKDVITIVALIDQNKQDYKQEDVIKLVNDVIKKQNIEKKEKKQFKKDINKFGDKLISEKYPELEMRFQCQPIDEMGVVALFCIVFDWMRGITFHLKEYKYTMNFKSIKYVRTAFPDACLICSIDDPKKTNTEIQIEFEYKSLEYLRHKHHESHKKCDLIVCWEDNAKNDRIIKSSVIDSLPPIIELKDFIKTGRINLK